MCGAPQGGQCRRDGELPAGRKAKGLQYVSRIPLPHTGSFISLYAAFPLCHTSVRTAQNKGGIFMPSSTLYPHPFSAGYWRQALDDMKKPRILTFSALMIAACWALGLIPSIHMGAARISWGFMARALCSMVGGPLNALVFGAAEDTITYLLHPTGPYFPGYMLTTMLGNLTYALFLYRAKPSVPRVFFAKLLTNAQNVVLGSLWSYILGGQAYRVIMMERLVKNAITLIPQTVILCVLFAALLPILRRARLIDW